MSKSRGIIDIKELGALLAETARSAAVHVPLGRPDGSTGLERLPAEAGAEATLRFDGPISRDSLKGIFFPQREALLSFQGDTLQAAPLPGERIVVFGVRPCDTRALGALDQVFAEEGGRFQDPYYSRRRESSVIISLACAAPGEECFCAAVGGHPAGTDGTDVLAFRLGERLLLEAVTARGETFLDGQAARLRPATAEDDAARDAQVRRAIQVQRTAQVQRTEQLSPALPLPPIEPRSFQKKLAAGFDHPVWETIARECLGCGACTYLCPTCHCFDITDEADGRGTGLRLRSWDSCQYALFTRHASGHNPRVNRKQRLRQRVMHKFAYAVENQGRLYCVGCGRCLRACPVNLDIRRVLATLAGL